MPIRTAAAPLCLLAVLLFPAGPVAAHAAGVERHLYREESPTGTRFFRWTLRSASRRLVTVEPGEQTETRLDTAGRTSRWCRRSREEGTAVRVRRQGEALILAGTLQGEPVAKRVAIDGAPWYQAMSLSLRPFVRGEREQVRFWTLRPDTLEAYQIEAQKAGLESLAIGGKRRLAQRVVIRLMGWRSLFWSARYWFDAASGVFLRYVGPGGPPGTPEIRVVLVAPDQAPAGVPAARPGGGACRP